MIGLLIIAHEGIGEAYYGLIEHFFLDNPPKNIRILSVNARSSHSRIIEQARKLIAELNSSVGILIMTDIFGATPCNAVQQLVEGGKTAILTGLNAPMVIKAAGYAHTASDLSALIQLVKKAAVEGIIDITSLKDMSYAETVD